MKKTMRLMPIALALALLCGCRPQAKPTPPAASPSPTAQTSPQTEAAKATADTENYLLVQPDNPETPAPTQKTEAGTVPETQTFLNYTSTEGKYDVQAPDTWKKDAKGPNVKFTHAMSGIEVQIVKTTEPFTLESIKGVQVASLVRTGRAVDVKLVSMADTKGGQAVYVEYESNSEPDDGDKKIRLANHRYYFHRNGLLAVLTLWAPAGADNDNIWKQIPDTFYWR